MQKQSLTRFVELVCSCLLLLKLLLATGWSTSAHAQTTDYGELIGNFDLPGQSSDTGEAYVSVKGAFCQSLITVTETHSAESFQVIREKKPAFQIDPGEVLARHGISLEHCGDKARIFMVAREITTGEVLGHHGLGRWLNSTAFDQIVAIRVEQIRGSWPYLDLEALPENKDMWIRVTDIPNRELVPEDPKLGVLVGLVGQSIQSSRGWTKSGYRPVYSKFFPAGCAIVQSVVVDPREMPHAPPRVYPVRSLGSVLTEIAASTSNCAPIQYFSRYVAADGHGLAFFSMQQKVIRIDQETFENSVGRTAVSVALPPLPEGLEEETGWDHAYYGRFDDTVKHAVLLYSGIVGAHSRNVTKNGMKCAYDDDRFYEIRQTYADGTPINERPAIFLPERQVALFGRLVENARLEPLFMRSVRADANKISAADGCRGPRVKIIRENLFRFITGRKQLEESELAQWASEP